MSINAADILCFTTGSAKWVRFNHKTMTTVLFVDIWDLLPTSLLMNNFRIQNN